MFDFECSLQELHLHNNHLSSLPDEMKILRHLFVLVLAFNRFTSLPRVLTWMSKLNVSEIENVILAGNQVCYTTTFLELVVGILRH